MVIQLTAGPGDEVKATKGLLEVGILQLKLGPLIFGLVIKKERFGEGVEIGEWVAGKVLEEALDVVEICILEKFPRHGSVDIKLMIEYNVVLSFWFRLIKSSKNNLKNYFQSANCKFYLMLSEGKISYLPKLHNL